MRTLSRVLGWYISLSVVISASLATVGLLEPMPSAFGYILEPQTNIKEVQPLVRDVENLKGAKSEKTQNQGLVHQDLAPERIQSLPVAVAIPPTQSSQLSFAREIAQVINTFGMVFLPSVVIGYILGELRSIKERAKRTTVQHSHVIGVFHNREAAGQALDQLVLSGFPLTKIFLIGEDLALNNQSVDTEITSVFVKPICAGTIPLTTGGVKESLAIGKVLGGLIGLVLGLGILAWLDVDQIALTPAVGFTLLCGSICTAAGGIIGALVDLRMTKKRIKEYVERVAHGDYLVIINGTKNEIEKAKRILNIKRICSIRVKP